MKKFVVFVIILSLFAAFSVLAFADEGVRLVDGANLLTDSEEAQLLALLDETSSRAQCDIVVVTAESIGNANPETYVENLFKEGGYGFGESGDGALFLISMEYRDWAIYSSNLSDSTVEDIGNDAAYYLSDGRYYDAFVTFADGIESKLASSEDGDGAFPLLRNIIIALVVGLVIAFISVSVMKGKLKTVRACNNAKNYVRDGSFNLKHSRDLYLYSTVTRVPRPKNNTSGGGRSGGGGRASGKF